MNTWNFRGYIAIPLEQFARETLPNTSFSADYIESGGFVHVMYTLLDYLHGTDCDGFVSLCENYLDKPLHEIGEEKAKELFKEFCKRTECPYGED